jgi:hypothetical protein
MSDQERSAAAWNDENKMTELLGHALRGEYDELRKKLHDEGTQGEYTVTRILAVMSRVAGIGFEMPFYQTWLALQHNYNLSELAIKLCEFALADFDEAKSNEIAYTLFVAQDAVNIIWLADRLKLQVSDAAREMAEKLFDAAEAVKLGQHTVYSIETLRKQWPMAKGFTLPIIACPISVFEHAIVAQAKKEGAI